MGTNPIPFRINLGITGHRKDLPTTQVLKFKIKEALGIEEWINDKSFKDKSVFSLFNDHSIKQLKTVVHTSVAFTLYTALAEGADRIVAEVFLDLKSTIDTQIKVVLPLTQEDYLNDFVTPESKEQFNYLLKQDYNPIVLRKQNLHDQYKDAQEPEIKERKKQAYHNAGKYIVDHCDVLLAIWNGEYTNKKGGTSEVIKYAKEIGRPVIVICCKTQEPSLDVIPGVSPGNDGQFKLKPLNAEVIEQFEFFNSYQLKPEGEEKYVNNLYNEYFQQTDKIPESKSLQLSLIDYLKSNIFPYYAKASTLAKKYQLVYKRTGLSAYWLSTLAVIILVISVVFNFYLEIATILELIILIIILLIITCAHSVRAHTRWLENRFLVERIRIAPYFFLSDMEISEIKLSPYKNPKNESGQWMILAFKEIWNQFNQSWYEKNNYQQIYQELSPNLLSYIKKSWIGGQISYHENNLENKNKKWYHKSKKWWNRFLERGGKLIFFTAILCAFGHILIHLSHRPDLHILVNCLTVLSLSLPVIAAAFEGVRRQKEYSRNTKRSEWMLEALQSLSLKFDHLLADLKGNNPENISSRFHELLRETDQLMLHETQDWMLLMIQSDLEYIT